MNTLVGIVSYNGADDISRCLESVAAQSRPPVEVVVVDNASADETLDLVDAGVAALETTGTAARITSNATNRGFTQGANQILERALGHPRDIEVVVLLNQDAILDTTCLEAFAGGFAESPDLGAAGPRIHYPGTTTIQFAGGLLAQPRGVGFHRGHHEEDDGRYDRDEDVGFVTGAVMALRVEALRQVGVFDEVFSPGYYEDVDLCDRLRNAGRGVRYLHRAHAWHHESSSFTNREFRLRLSQRNRLIYLLPRFSDREFTEAFTDAEIRAIRTTLEPDEVRAVAAGSLEVLARLDWFLRVRRVAEPESARARAGRILRLVRHETATRLSGIAPPA